MARARGDDGRMPAPILVGHDPSSTAVGPVVFAAAAAQLLDAPLIVVTVHRGGNGMHEVASGEPDTGSSDDAHAALAALERAVPALARDAVELRGVDGHSAAQGLHRVAEAEGAGLVVVGTSHRGRTERAVLGRTAEADGEKSIWQDLRARLYVSEPELKAHYAASPTWLKRLMDAWAAGLNHYLATHPNVRPRVLTRFEPWMALSFTEGSIGGDIERIDLGELHEFYAGKRTLAAAEPDYEPRGSNGIAIAPPITSGGN